LDIGIEVCSNDNCRILVGDDNDIGDDIVELFPIEELPLILVPRGKLRLCGFAGRVVAVTVLVVVPPTSSIRLDSAAVMSNSPQ
jgi:hypothetical protein